MKFSLDRLGLSGRECVCFFLLHLERQKRLRLRLRLRDRQDRIAKGVSMGARGNDVQLQCMGHRGAQLHVLLMDPSRTHSGPQYGLKLGST